MTTKKYTSVSELLGAVSTDKPFNKRVEEAINSRHISKLLTIMRGKQGITQGELAKRIGCSQAKISKLESAEDMELAIGDIVNYCGALDMRLEIGFSEQGMTMADRVKMHFFGLKGLLDEMREMSRGDETMERGVEKFHTEAFCNITYGLLDCLQKAKAGKESSLPLHVTEPFRVSGVDTNTEIHTSSK